MKKLHNKDWKYISIIFGIILIFILIIICSKYIYGSETDWISQHFRLPEYIRNLFYETKNLFPQFTFHLGAGQNIYNLTYYGLFNPLIILSYAFPYISMKNFITGIHIILLLISIIYIYKWTKDKYNSKVAFISTIIYAFSGSLLYHTHRHIMFVDYMLFQIIALINVEKYFKDKKTINLILSIFITILISYYFSVGCLFAILVFAIYNYIKYEKNINIQTFFKEGIKFIGVILIPILLASFSLLPTAYTLFSGRSDTQVVLDKFDVLIPTINSKIFLIDSYSVGLTSIIIYAIIDSLFNKNKENKFLSIFLLILFTFPIFNIILNGGMYISGKSLIPFLPICILLIAESINNILNKKIEKNTLISFTIFCIITIILNHSYNKLFLIIIDIIILLTTIILIKYKTNNFKIFIPYSLLIITICLITNYSDKLVTKEKYNDIETKNNINIHELYDEDYYRTANLTNILENSNNILDKQYYTTNIYTSSSNTEYLNLLRNTFKNEIYNKDYHTITQSSNIFFNVYMGNKYLISDYSLKGYDLKIDSDTNAYINNDVFNIGYANNKLMSLDEFNSLSYPYSMDALLNYTIVDKKLPNTYESNIEKFNNTLTIENIDFSYTKNNEHYKFYVEKEKKLTLKLNNPTDKILIISFDMNQEEKCSIGNPSITINGTTNTLSCASWKYYNKNETFHYVLSSNEPIDELNINITKGHYDISNIKIYEYNYNNLKKIKNTHDKFIIENITDQEIKGNINVSNNGYFQISIPYDLGFKIYVDDIETEYEKINTAFIGFKINEGIHKITIKYEAPLSKLGNIISIITLIGTGSYYTIKYTYKKNKNNKI